jgi:shikimate kinase
MATESPLLTDLNLIITGYIEPNRPRVARQLSERLNLQLVDVERQIEDRFGDSLANIRSIYGERRLKTVETDIMDEVALHRSTVIRVSGSTLLNSGHLKELQRTGPVICLVASLDSILKRIHLTLGARYHNPAERAVAVGGIQREWKIREQEDIYEFDATYKQEAELIDDIVVFWRDIALRRG